MIQLEENKGIPRSILIMMSVVAGLTVANLYYNQPLLEEMKASLGANEVETNLITVITQAGYAAGLLFVVPLADMLSRRKIIMTNMATAVLMALVIAYGRYKSSVGGIIYIRNVLCSTADIRTDGGIVLQTRK